jgi:hypothetical protein
VGLVEIREYLLLKYDGTVERFPLTDGNFAQAQVRAFLCQHPGDDVVAVTDDSWAGNSSATCGNRS